MSKIREIHNRHHAKNKEHWHCNGFKNLLVWLSLYLVVAPFLSGLPYADAIVSVLLTVVLVSSIDAISGSRRLLVTAVIVLVVLLVMMWLMNMDIISPKMNVSSLAFASFMAILVYSFSETLFRVRQVNSNVVCAALCLYLVVGLFFGALYTLLESLVPGSFLGALLKDTHSAHEIAHHFHYFSFVTLSTLGYGDISPHTRGAGALCQAEAVIGQFITVVLVARLVGIQVSQESAVAEEKKSKVTSAPK